MTLTIQLPTAGDEHACSSQQTLLFLQQLQHGVLEKQKDAMWRAQQLAEALSSVCSTLTLQCTPPNRDNPAVLATAGHSQKTFVDLCAFCGHRTKIDHVASISLAEHQVVAMSSFNKVEEEAAGDGSGNKKTYVGAYRQQNVAG